MTVLRHSFKLLDSLPPRGEVNVSPRSNLTDGPRECIRSNAMPVSSFHTRALKKIGSFHFLTLGTFYLGTQPPFCKEVQVPGREAHMERNQGAWISAPAELLPTWVKAMWVNHLGSDPPAPYQVTPADTLRSKHMSLLQWALQIWRIKNSCSFLST